MRKAALALMVIILFLATSPGLFAQTSHAAAGTGLRGDYYNNMDFTALKLGRTDPTINFSWGQLAPATSIGADTFSVRWTGQVQPLYAETYTFYTRSDDGVRLWVNDQRIIDHWATQSLTERRGTIALTAGTHYSIKLEYFESKSSAAISLLWSSARQTKQVIPQSQLYAPAAVGTASPTRTATTAPASVTPTKVPTATPTNTASPTTTPMATPTATPSDTPTAAPSPTPSTAKLLFGIGPEADSAIRTRLAQENSVRLLTSWYNSPADLAWMTGWRYNLVPQSYGTGFALHLIVFSDDPETSFPTSYGPACGRPYPLSDRFLGDMQQLAQTFAGNANTPPLYVTLFTEVQTYACTDNAWFPNTESNTYYLALKDRYRAAYAVFHQYAPNVRVSLGWGGWQARWNDPATGGGRAMIDAFADVLHSSDFQSFQAMQADTNVDDVRAMVNILGAYGPVMLAHYKPDNGSAATFEADVRAMLTDAYLNEMTAAGLFAWSFMDESNLSQSESVYQFTKDAVVRYGVAAR